MNEFKKEKLKKEQTIEKIISNNFCLDEFFKIIDFNNSEEILSKIKYQKTDTNDNRHKIKID